MGHNPSSVRELSTTPTPAVHAETTPHEANFTHQRVQRPKAVYIVLTLIVALGILGALFLLGWMPLQQRETALATDAARIKAAPPRVAIVNPKRASPVSEILLPSQIEAVRETTINARTSGYLKRWLADLGDSVKTGQLLAEIDSPEVDMQLEQARATTEQTRATLEQSLAALERAKADLANAEATAAQADLTMQRYEKLRGTNSVSEQDVSQKETDVKTTHAAVLADKAAIVSAQATISASRANVSAAEADVRRLEVMKSFEKVLAPFDGTITSRQIEAGSLITAGSGSAQTLFQISCTDPVRVFIDVPQAYAPAIKTGQTVQLLVREYPANKYTGTVARTAHAIDTASRTLKTEVHVPNPDGELLKGMYAQVKLEVRQDTPPLVLPGSALIVNADGTQVALVKDGHIHFQKITVESDSGATFTVSAGLAEKDDVVSTPSERLTEGTAVSVAAPNP